MAQISIYLLGNFQVRVDDQYVTRKFRTDKERALLAYLAMEGKRPISREILAEMFWPDRFEGVGRTNLRQAILGMRKAIGDVGAAQPLLLVNDESIQINRHASFWFDTLAFNERFQAGFEHQHASLTICPLCAQGLQEAVELYRQDFLEGLYINDSPIFQEWLMFHREQFQRYLLDTLDHLGEFYQNQGELETAQKYAWLHVKQAPLEERAYRRLMELLSLSGRRSAALEQFQTLQRVLLRELGVDPSPETQQLFEKIRSGQAIISNEGSQIAQGNGLPRPMTEFIGRETELKSIRNCFQNSNCRLVAISGMPGVGKSRLAIEAAQSQPELFPDGVLYISLEGMHSQDLFLPALGRALGLTLSLANPRLQIFRRLGGMQALLIIDQFDGMHDSTDMLMELLQSAPSLKIIVTSHQRLEVQSASLIPLDGLPYTTDPAEEQALQSPAVRLFLNRALRSRPGLTVDQEALTCILEICQLVNGLPLALELAADRLRELSLPTIAISLQNGLNVLSTSLRDVPERHRSLEKALLSAWQNLDDNQQALLERLPVFQVSFKPEAAQAICQAKPQVLAGLAGKSFLQGMLRGRYGLSPLVRQLSLSLAQPDETVKIQLNNQHAAYYLGLLHKLAGQIKPELPRSQVLEEIQTEMDHIIQAMDWSLATGQRARAVQASRDLQHYKNAYQVYAQCSNGSSVASLNVQAFALQQEPFQGLETSGFCCDRRDHLPDANNAAIIADENEQILAANFLAQQLSGYTLEALLGMKTHELGLIATHEAWDVSPLLDTYLMQRSGNLLPVEVLRLPSQKICEFSSLYFLKKRDETGAEKGLALIDPLSNLPNFQVFSVQLRRSISQASSSNQQVAVLVLGLDGFKLLQRKLGLETSQELLRQAAARLRVNLRREDILASLNDTEFGLILENLPEADVTKLVASRLLGLFEAPFLVKDRSFELKVSVGESIYPRDGSDIEGLLEHAHRSRKEVLDE